MTRLVRLESRASTRAVAGLMTVALHVGVLVLVGLSGGRRDGIHDDDVPVTRIVFMDSHVADRRDRIERAPWYPAIPTLTHGEQPAIEDIQPPTLLPVEFDASREHADEMPLADVEVPAETALASAVEPPGTFVMPETQAAALAEHVERVARGLTSERARVTWTQDGRQYEAELVLEPASAGIEPDRVVAEISAEDQGRQLRTRFMLKRLPFTYFAKFVDRWDPLVELHDDQIVGRMHINSWFKLLHDSQAMPAFLGKVSTAAGGFDVRSPGGRRVAEAFREGIETRAGRIALSEQGPALERAKRERDARLHELARDTHITFFADGSYRLRDRQSGTTRSVEPPAGKSVYFIAARGATVYVQGVVAGRFLVYSPRKIVVEGNLVYARDPRENRDSDDYIGLVCDRDIEVAPPRVTGLGDLQVQAALFARRRFVVAHFQYPRSATLNIYGSLAAGSLTASEPRYATRIEYDVRFERLRPPGFPSTDRFAAEDWDGTWTVVHERSQAAAF